jgi:WS/DGAT/MGAT family acyltransferase
MAMTARIRLSLQDELFLRAETRETPVHVGGLQIFRIPPRAPAHFVSTLAARLRSHPVSVAPLNYRLAGGITGKVMPSWEVDPDVDLDYHFSQSALPGPGGEKELGMLVSRLHSTPMDLTRPLWEYHLIECRSGGRFATYTKLHHAMFDGAAGMRLVNLSARRSASNVPPFWADQSRQPHEAAAAPASTLGQVPAMIEDEVKSLPGLVRSLGPRRSRHSAWGATPTLCRSPRLPARFSTSRSGRSGAWRRTR